MWANLDPSLMEGGFWRISEDLVASRDLVVPKPLHRGPTDIVSQRFAERNGIIILGIYYEIHGNNAGFDLVAVDDTVVDGATTTLTIIAPRTPAVANSRVCEAITPCCIPLSPAEVAPTPVNGATLRLNISGTPTGRVLIWGIHGTLATHFPPKSFTGSPTSFT
jgi:hypothetical protein